MQNDLNAVCVVGFCQTGIYNQWKCLLLTDYFMLKPNLPRTADKTLISFTVLFMWNSYAFAISRSANK